VDFQSALFTEEAAFWGARFSASTQFVLANFQWAAFSGTTFEGPADFTSAKFGNIANFHDVTFGSLKFAHAKLLGDASFNHATFTADADFTHTTFGQKTSFSEATFKGYLRFSDEPFLIESSVDFQFLRAERPDHVSFYTATLRPRWFINLDPRRFDFTAVKWCFESVDQDLMAVRSEKHSFPERLLAKTYREIAVNCEENHRYEEASKFRYLAMDVLRRAQSRGFAFWRLDWWYWAVSGYGERIGRAFVMLVAVWIVFALLYTQVGFSAQQDDRTVSTPTVTQIHDGPAQSLDFKRAATYSIEIMALQKPDPRPVTVTARVLVILQTVLGPFQAALLALAIRRKFMR
jgi:hypothetical protein